MKKLSIIVLAIVIVACGQTAKEKSEELGNKQEMEMKIQELESEAFNSQEMLNKAKVKELVTLYEGYVDNNQSSELAPEYLYRSVELFVGTELYQEAISAADRLIKHYPEFDKSPQALYLKAFIYDEHLDQKGKAQEVYEEVIEKYPRHTLANDARASIKMLNMSEEEIIQMLEEKNK